MVAQDKLAKAKELLLSGQFDAALDLCQKALNPFLLKESSEVFVLTGDIYAKKNLLNETISSYLNALNLNPSNQDAWIKFAGSIKFASFHVFNELIKKTIIKCLDNPNICDQNLAFPGISLLKLSDSFAEVSAILSNREPLKCILNKIELQSIAFLEDQLLISLLEKTLIPDHTLERFFTLIRHALLIRPKIPERYYAFLKALAMQCFTNEYIYFVTEVEQQALKKLKQNSSASSSPEQITLIGCYQPFFQLSYAENITYPEMDFLIKELVTEPLEELKLVKQIPALTPITDDISTKVALQYEENPYPRWKSIDRKHPKSIQYMLQDIFPFKVIPNSFSLKPKILIAGCGTGQHAINSANTYEDCEVLAIDLSRQSLAYAIRKASEFKVKNISFLQADILDLKLLGRTFDVIECSGVLHHMENPFKGWQVLTDLLNPNGVMAIGLYSELARQDVVAARSFIKKHHYETTLDDIRKCRQQIFQLPPENLIHNLTKSMDFYSTSTCRDLMFHVQEHRFTIPQLTEMIQQLELEFIGFELKDQAVLKCYREKFPEDPEAISLTNWHQFELQHPQTFIGMYNLWLRKRS